MDSQRYGLFRPVCSWVLFILVCYASSLVSRPHVRADEPNPSVKSNDEVESLIEQLSDPAFAAREAASKRLLEIGAPTLERLRQAQKHASLEVQERAKRICEEIDKVVFESVAKKFILAADGTQSFGLPAWKAFRSISGDSRSSKLLFVTMLRSQPELAALIDAATAVSEEANSVLAYEQLASKASSEAERLRSRSNRGELPAVGDTVGLLMACSMFNDTSSIASPSNEVNEVIVASLFRGPQTDYFSQAGYGRCLRALAGKWISKTQSALADDVLALAMQQAIPEGAIIARRHLSPSSDRETRVRALKCLARFGNEADIESVSKLLNDESIVYEFPDLGPIGLPRDGIREEDMPPPGLQRPKVPADEHRMIVRLNDVALAVCMTLGAEDLTKSFPNFVPSDSNPLQLADCAFASDAQEYHKLAIARWKQKHPQFVEKAN